MKKKTLWQIILILAVVLMATFAVMAVLNARQDQKTNQEQLNGDEKESQYTVTFYSNDGTVLKIDSVEKGKTANPPAKPQMLYGTVFQSWDTDISSVTKNLEVRPICEDVKEKQNIFAIEGAYGKSGGTVIVPIRLCGDVCTSAFDLTINYDSDVLKLTSVKEDGGVIYNDETPGKINLNYVSVDNTTADVDICYLEFSIKSEIEQSVISLEMNKIYAYDEKAQDDDVKMIIPKYTIVNGTVFVLSKGE